MMSLVRGIVATVILAGAGAGVGSAVTVAGNKTVNQYAQYVQQTNQKALTNAVNVFAGN